MHPDCAQPQALQAVMESLATGIRPAFDKSLRWNYEHPERLADVWSWQTDEATILSTINTNTITTYIYTHNSEDVMALIRKAHRSETIKVYTFSQVTTAKKVHTSHGFLGKIMEQAETSWHVRQIGCDKQELDQIRALDNGAEMAGLVFLASQIAERDDIGPSLGYFTEGELVGVIGPLSIGVDIAGRRYLLPPYFGVHASMRGKGVGRELWNAAMNYAVKEEAKYVLVQAEDDAASEQFYRRQMLQDIGGLFRHNLATA